jgi:RNA polymerase sigma factor (sigma-70 family)
LAGTRDQEFARYVAGSWDLLRSRAFRLCRDWDYAADLVQSTLVLAYRRWGLLEQASSRDAYVTTIMARLHYRECQKSRWKAETTMPEGLEVSTPDASADAVSDRLILKAALAQLGPRQRAVVSLRFLYDLPVDEVAQILMCEPSTVRSQTQRALARLREILRDAESLPTPGTLGEYGSWPYGAHISLLKTVAVS